MKEADLLIKEGLVEDRSKTGFNQQLKSPPIIRWYVLRSGNKENNQTIQSRTCQTPGPNKIDTPRALAGKDE